MLFPCLVLPILLIGRNSYQMMSWVLIHLSSMQVSKKDIHSRFTKIRLNIANPLATHTGKVTLNLARAVPNPGPRIKPKPKATPIKPKVFARFFV